MDSGSIIQLIILVLCLMVSAFFSSAETALTTVNKIKLRSLIDEGNKSAVFLGKIIDNPGKMLSAILIGNNIVNISASALATVFTQHVFGNYAVSIATGILTVLILIFGEITPKTFATIHADSIALKYSYIIYAIMWILTPVIFLINGISLGILKLLGIKPDDKQKAITETELRTIVDVSHEEGITSSEEKQIINNLFDFGDAQAKDVMVPRINATCIDINASYDELVNIFKEDMFTRIPVYDDSPDNIVGIINIKDLFFIENKDDFNIKDFLREAYYTYEHKMISELMLEMRKASVNFIVVLDEYGAAAGIITLEDLLEEIVGEIRDEFDEDESEPIIKLSDNEYIAEGQVSLDDINEIAGINLESDDFDSIGGFIIEKLDRLPQKGDYVTEENVRLVVDSIDKNRIDAVHIYIEFCE